MLCTKTQCTVIHHSIFIKFTFFLGHIYSRLFRSIHSFIFIHSFCHIVARHSNAMHTYFSFHSIFSLFFCRRLYWNRIIFSSFWSYFVQFIQHFLFKGHAIHIERLPRKKQQQEHFLSIFFSHFSCNNFNKNKNKT